MSPQAQKEPTERILISENTEQFENTVKYAETLLPLLSEVLTSYQANKFETKISDAETLADLLRAPESFIETERLKAVPADINGMPINKVKFLYEIAEKPATVEALERAIEAVRSKGVDWAFYTIDKKGIRLNTEYIGTYKEQVKTYATGKQAELLKLAMELEKLANEFHRLHVNQPWGLLSFHFGGSYEGDHSRYYIQNKRFCLQYEAQ
ncbi:hypothetical protein Q0590_08465 [Rhodocytophaga aerolata]|uniref:Uncharacterized protein n=1 Tax=Rhodocytophaga aerolata TaxID=455078 RepID=A0ABT8R2G0_9BACT|nr:hypothetical protein [Rhodocytophaga aerolata]MDO1446282.1 hypothetical protein [Rhodocytophaga aerolata]